MAQREDKRDELIHPEVLPVAQNARMSQFLTPNLALMADSTILKRSLSLNTVILTTSSFSIRFQNARSRPHLEQLN
ncbi:hypothetical protein N7517_003570 [Penicillium concentricum]|uniref:Uncharacterized protein n=1 Tax=Penicillium concentricum TaxID=293559 RepID=A0A9W9S5X6_9EURO|nr:uncharacterized protein N7517_003570 [Penicillium concentricum]KAJ5371564.1 hypothetical protein N7517_003570 [Penicillium concentricum]